MRTQAEIIANALDNKGISAYRLAKDTGKSKQYIADLLHGRTEAKNPDTVHTLADALDIDSDTLFLAAGMVPPDILTAMQADPGIVKSVRQIERQRPRTT